MKVLSLFDGMACGALALQAAGIEIESYDAFEIDKYAVQTSQHNFPFIKHHGDVFTADFTQFKGVDLVCGGSPCTYWSIAQKNNRETEASGMGWELFQQYVRAIREAEPKYFIYENNKSMSKAIRDSIDKAFGFEAVLINSALVSAQNRQRLYWVGKRNADGTYSKVNVEQPEDRGILLKDILEGGEAVCVAERGRYENGKVVQHYEARADGKTNVLTTVQKDNNVAEPVCHIIPQEVRVRKYTCDIEKLKSVLREHKCLTNREIAEALNKPITLVEHWFRKDDCFAVPDEDIWFDLKKLLGIQSTEFDNFVTVFEEREGIFEKSHRCYDVNGKMSTLMTGKTDNIIEPICLNSKSGRGGVEGLQPSLQDRIYSIEGKHTAVTTSFMPKVAEPIRVGCMPSPSGEMQNSQAFRVYSTEGKSVNLLGQGGGAGAKTGLYAIPVEFDGDIPTKAVSVADGKTYAVYEVKDGKITIKGKQYPIKLVDGFYIIRKLTVRECMRLQTVPEWYEFPVSDSQAYKMLGNGWTVLIISWLLTSLKGWDSNKSRRYRTPERSGTFG
jgi:DNA (cytosine-5)-methyltransferase 3A